jgi:hypothetical protein
MGVQRRRLVALSKVSQPCSNSPESISPRLGRVFHTRHFTPLESTNSRTAIPEFSFGKADSSRSRHSEH